MSNIPPLYKMKLRFRLDMGLKDLNEVLELLKIERPVLKNAATVTMTQTLPIIPDEETIRKYENIIKKGYSGGNIICEECTFDGYAYITPVRIYTWKDIVSINGNIFTESAEISGKYDENSDSYELDDFYKTIAEKHHVNTDEILTYRMDNIPFDPSGLEYGAEDCGLYINGVPAECEEETAPDKTM